MRTEARSDRLWAYVVTLFCVVFLGWFVIVERTGFEALLELLFDAVAFIPTSVANILTYFGDVSRTSLLSSVIIGGGFGALLTSLVFANKRGTLRIPPLHPISVWIGAIAGLAALLFGIILLYAVAITIAIMLIAGVALQRDLRQFLSHEWTRQIRDTSTQRAALVGLISGGIVGAIGAQLLTVPTQHCTFASEADIPTRQLGVLITLVGSLLILIPFWTLMVRQGKARNLGSAGYFTNPALPYILLAPTVIVLTIFLYFPTIQVSEQSLFRIPRRRNAEPIFQCMDNFVELANDTVYTNSFLTTLSITFAIVTISMGLALLIALLASQKIKGAGIYRTLIIWPYALSPVVASVVLISLFRDDQSGFFNYMLVEWFDARPVRWLNDPDVVPWVIVASAVYNIVGFNVIFYIAGLQNVPRDLMEAAQIDGANVVQRFLRITIPMVSPYTFFLLVANITYSFYGIYGVLDAFFPEGLPPTMDGGRAGNVLIYNLYKESFGTTSSLGSAAAQTVVLFLLVAGITILQFRFVENRVTYSE